MKITTDHKFRNILCGYELTEKERVDFDYIDDIDSHDFFRYRGAVYDPDEFMAVPDSDEFKGWHGYQSDTFFSGVLIRYSADYEQIMVGRYAV